MRVVVERPRSDHVVGHVEDVAPGITRADGVGASAAVGLRSKRPGAVGIYAVAEPMGVQRVGRIISVPDVNRQSLIGVCVDHWAGYAFLVERLIDVGAD